METATAFVNAFLNDPGDPALTFEHAWPSPSVGCFLIPGWSGAGGDFQPGTPTFEAGHLAVILAQTFDTWVSYFGGRFDWQPGGALRIVPRAGRDLNAYYDRTALKFFYDTDAKTKQTVYSCESCDIVAHECGHAVLDAHHPDYWDSLHPETGAFHEAFADISALLNTLQFPSVRASLLQQTGGDLTKDSGVSRLAEQLGRALYDAYGSDACAPNALRDLINPFRYRPTYKLPARAPASKLSSESHSFSRVFSAAFYDVLTGIYAALRQENAALTEDQALSQARDEAGRLIANALLLAPPGDAIYAVIAGAMLKADQQKNAGKYFPILRKVFVKRRLLSAKDTDVYKPHTLTAAGKTRAVRPGLLSVEGLAEGAAAPEPVARAMRFAPEELTTARTLGEPGGGRTVQLRANRTLRLRGKEFGPADGALVPVPEGASLTLDARGMVAASSSYHASAETTRAVRDHVVKLARRGRIYDAKPGDQAELALLIAQRKPYFIDHDAEGNKIIRRAFIACTGLG